MLRRNEKIAFHGGAWVFPGGRVDAADGADDELDVARRAAVRETQEETGLAVSATDMFPFAHWTTPVQMPKRFATWFFVAPFQGSSEVIIDNSEIVDSAWLTPARALEMHSLTELELPAPTFVTLATFLRHASVAELVAHVRTTPIQRFFPRLVPVDGGRCTVYQEDAGYETLDFNAPGPRHRLIMVGANWQYLRDF